MLRRVYRLVRCIGLNCLDAISTDRRTWDSRAVGRFSPPQSLAIEHEEQRATSTATLVSRWLRELCGCRGDSRTMCATTCVERRWRKRGSVRASEHFLGTEFPVGLTSDRRQVYRARKLETPTFASSRCQNRLPAAGPLETQFRRDSYSPDCTDRPSPRLDTQRHKAPGSG